MQNYCTVHVQFYVDALNQIWYNVKLKEGNSPSCDKREKRTSFHRPILATQLCLSPPKPIQYDTDFHYTIHSDIQFA